MTDIKDMSIEELNKWANITLNADDDMGLTISREASEELRKRAEAVDKINYPNGHPLPALEVRIAQHLNAAFGPNRVSSASLLVRDIIKEVHRK